MELSRTIFSKRYLAASLVIDFLALIGMVLFHWNLANVIFIFLAETIIFCLYALARMTFARADLNASKFSEALLSGIFHILVLAVAGSFYYYLLKDMMNLTGSSYFIFIGISVALIYVISVITEYLIAGLWSSAGLGKLIKEKWGRLYLLLFAFLFGVLFLSPFIGEGFASLLAFLMIKLVMDLAQQYGVKEFFAL